MKRCISRLLQLPESGVRLPVGGLLRATIRRASSPTNETKKKSTNNTHHTRIKDLYFSLFIMSAPRKITCDSDVCPKCPCKLLKKIHARLKREEQYRTSGKFQFGKKNVYSDKVKHVPCTKFRSNHSGEFRFVENSIIIT